MQEVPVLAHQSNGSGRAAAFKIIMPMARFASCRANVIKQLDESICSQCRNNRRAEIVREIISINVIEQFKRINLNEAVLGGLFYVLMLVPAARGVPGGG